MLPTLYNIMYPTNCETLNMTFEDARDVLANILMGHDPVDQRQQTP